MVLSRGLLELWLEVLWVVIQGCIRIESYYGGIDCAIQLKYIKLRVWGVIKV